MVKSINAELSYYLLKCWRICEMNSDDKLTCRSTTFKDYIRRLRTLRFMRYMDIVMVCRPFHCNV